MTVEALKQFIIAQGSSRSVVQMEWDKLWTINKQTIDVKAPRHTAVLKDNLVIVNVVDVNDESSQQLPKHPKVGSTGSADLMPA
jgi:bifunctional glutamyl/prolyl-tRNA synthetase